MREDEGKSELAAGLPNAWQSSFVDTMYADEFPEGQN